MKKKKYPKEKITDKQRIEDFGKVLEVLFSRMSLEDVKIVAETTIKDLTRRAKWEAGD